jgi:putative transport protein
VGLTVAQAERDLLPGERIFVEASAAAASIIEVTPDTVLRAGDVVAIAGRREVLVNVLGQGVEVDDATC